jgi:hypothetical protein
MLYSTPPEHLLRLHFERSRFARKLEDVLLVLASRIVNIGMMEKEQFDKLLDKIITEINTEPLVEKTIRNQRTEMIRLFGLVKYVDNLAIPGNRLSLLTQTQDTPRFFKSFCNRFQFPGGFLKPDKVSEMVVAGVKFKPAQYILRMFKIATSRHGEFALSAAEATHFILYDKRVTVQNEAPDKALDRIMEARKNNIELDKTGDVIRYARDFLNYMVEANLLTEFKGMYAINDGEKRAIQSIIGDKNFFDGYSAVIKSDGSWNKDEYKKVDTEWMEWFADGLEDEALETPATALVRDENNYPEQWKKIKEILERKDPKMRGSALKELGDEGERIAYEYEKDTVKKIRPDLVQLVRVVSTTAALGYDIISVQAEEGRKKKYIEVKTTKKNHESDIMIPFTISINEWSVAQQLKDDYFIYRVIITKEGVTIFSIQNPPQRTAEGNLFIEPIGYKVVYSSKSGNLLKM